jgi:hypothetical protein
MTICLVFETINWGVVIKVGNVVRSVIHCKLSRTFSCSLYVTNFAPTLYGPEENFVFPKNY